MEVGSTGSTGSASGLPNRFSDMSSEDFIRVMFTELQNQDPLNPQDSNAMLDQISNLRNIESQIDLQTSLKQLVAGNQIASAGGMIGKLVKGLNDSNENIDGIVTSVRVSNDRVFLELDSGQTLDMSRVTRISPVTEAGSAVPA